MASYLVLEPPGDRTDKAEKALVIRDGFSLLALIMPLLWFLWHRMWLEALAFVAVALLLAGLGTLPGFTMLAPLLSFFLYIFIGLEAQALRVAALGRRGWQVWGVVEGANSDEAELRYAAEVGQESSRRAPAAPAVAGSRGGTGQRPSPATFGLIDYPRKG
ncbi:DUF2628 domain-containing protein [Chelativorans sp. J32]|uniref:DUF2628 domain-containing protein n=1 Tax=Chelativorans sp. J32 TaxID=935840 RepID=UPI0004822D9F|nr:DUF2628 domain-containing protein [Chelativorans sp. J32]